MAAPIQGITGVLPLPPTTEIQPANGKGGPDFGNALASALGEAGKAERAADDAAKRFAAGDPQLGIHEVMIASEKAQISVRYAVTLKNRLLEAYRELMNTQI
jgi:flagellar hook-basal body complex protein FliE